MSVDMFLKCEGVEGEAQDDKHKNEIDVLAWSWGASQSGTTHMGAGGGAGKVAVQDLSVTKYVDKASTDMLLACCNGKHYGEMTLTVRKAGGDTPLEYIVIIMKDCIITSISTGGSGGEDRLTENVSINFANVELKYIEQKPDGGAASPKRFAWDIPANKKL